MATSQSMFTQRRTYRPGLFALLLPSGKWKVTLRASTPEKVRLTSGRDVDLHCLDVVSISTAKALLCIRSKSARAEDRQSLGTIGRNRGELAIERAMAVGAVPVKHVALGQGTTSRAARERPVESSLQDTFERTLAGTADLRGITRGRQQQPSFLCSVRLLPCPSRDPSRTA